MIHQKETSSALYQINGTFPNSAVQLLSSPENTVQLFIELLGNPHWKSPLEDSSPALCPRQGQLWNQTRLLKVLLSKQVLKLLREEAGCISHRCAVLAHRQAVPVGISSVGVPHSHRRTDRHGAAQAHQVQSGSPFLVPNLMETPPTDSLAEELVQEQQDWGSTYHFSMWKLFKLSPAVPGKKNTKT